MIRSPLRPWVRPCGPATMALLSLLLPLAACGGDVRAAGPAVRDSAGIRIVENEHPSWRRGEAWTVAAQPLLELGVAEGDPNLQFGRVADAVRLSDGTLLVADGQANELRAFDAQGRYLRTLGRAGGGPGEFRGLSELFLLPGDTVAAFDYQGARLSFFAPAGAFVRGVNLRPLEDRLPPKPLGVFGDGTLLVAPMYDPLFTNSPKPSRDTVPLARYTAAGAQSALLARVPGEETLTMVNTNGEGFAMRDRVPFGLGTWFAAEGERLLVADNARYELVERRPDGAVVRLVRRSGEREPVTEAERAAYLERRRAASPGRFRQAQARMLENLPFPERKGYFTGVRLDARGNAWVERHAAPGADTPWDVFDAEGRLLGTVTVPAGLRVTQIGADFIVGVWTDELDVHHVRVHRIRKPAAP